MIENRKYILITVFCLVGIVYIARLFYLQILDDSFSLEASNNSIKRVIEIPYRGQIYDRNGKLIVYNTPVYDIYVTPKKMYVPDTLAFCRLMGLERREFDSLIAAARSYSPVKPSLFLRQLSKEDFARIQDALVDYRGFEHVTSSMRTYPAHTMANALGYVSEVTRKELEEQETPYYRQGDYKGHSGLEEQYEEVLRGKRGMRFVMQNVRGVIKGSYKNGKFDTIAVAGQNLYTGIDVEIQRYADSLLVNKVGSVIAIEPATGQVLAIASSPTYDPNMLSSRYFSKNYSKLAKDPYKPLINRAVMASYRPGSTFKLIQALIGLQEGVLTPASQFGHGGVKMKCHGHPPGIHLLGAVQYSCNPYFYHVFRRLMYNNAERNTFKASAMGLRHWNEMAARWGIGQKLGIDLPSELKGKLPDVEYYDKIYGEMRWKFSNIYSLGIGEGELLISPLKMANVAAIIANRGYYYRPHIVAGIGKPGQGLDPKYSEKIEVGVDRHYFESVIDGMEMAVKAGTVTRGAIIPDIVMCGKTGTSQNAKGKKDHSIFVAFAPRDNPKIAIAVFVENAGFGGVAAAPIASLLVERYLKRKTLNTALDKRVKEMNFLAGALPTPKVQLKKPDTTKTPRPDTGRKPNGQRPFMVKSAPTVNRPLPVRPTALELKPLTPKPAVLKSGD
ncbi:peptidoglycan D,D-transpeptidase FtsI family protein [Tellurirhabdus rosea]|uniref:peptidoglycan D,D-transpeptidase FtsI family protein n=1 Tax=Tellurirhabdus rosea TaxID=2674997 RepID=UPI002259A275|nr:penicillin-binding transpeptidase domain-containing protein [Tellurirhabdus rosea]